MILIRKEMMIVKKLLFILMIATLIFAVGCVPPKPPVVENGIVCAGGIYSIHYGEWTQTGCEGEVIQAGTFWQNLNGRLFLLGEPVPFDPENTAASIVKIYGKCPSKFVVEIAVKEKIIWNL
jgi:hypothetical protein